jgi:hypothetical protein
MRASSKRSRALKERVAATLTEIKKEAVKG